jgi:hypothetical protein
MMVVDLNPLTALNALLAEGSVWRALRDGFASARLRGAARSHICAPPPATRCSFARAAGSRRKLERPAINRRHARDARRDRELGRCGRPKRSPQAIDRFRPVSPENRHGAQDNMFSLEI